MGRQECDHARRDGAIRGRTSGCSSSRSRKITENFSVDIELSLVLPNKVDTRTKLAEEYLESFEAEYGDTIAPNYVPYSQDIRNAAQRGVTAFELENPSATAKKAKNAYTAAVESLLIRLAEKRLYD